MQGVILKPLWNEREAQSPYRVCYFLSLPLSHICLKDREVIKQPITEHVRFACLLGYVDSGLYLEFIICVCVYTYI